MAFGQRTQVGPRNHALDGDHIPHVGMGNFNGEGAAYCKVYGHSVCGHLCKNGWTVQNAVCVVGLSGPKEARIRWGSRSPYAKEQLLGKNMCGCARQHSAVSYAKIAKPVKMPFGLWTRVGWRKHVLHGGTLAPPGEYDWTFRVLRRCGLVLNYFDHLFCFNNIPIVAQPEWYHYSVHSFVVLMLKVETDNIAAVFGCQST